MDGMQERICRSHPYSQLQGQKGVSIVGLDALFLTLEHTLLNTSSLGQYKESLTFFTFSDLTPTAGSRLKNVPQGSLFLISFQI